MKWKTLLSFFGIALFVYILFKINLGVVLQEIKNSDLGYLFLAISLVGFLLLTQTLKWHVIARKQKMNISFIESFKINLISGFYGFITPSKMGAIVRVDYLKKYSKDIGKGLANFVLDKILDIISVFLIFFVFFIKFKEKFSFVPILLLLGIFIAIVLFSFFIFKKNFVKPILKFLFERVVPKKIKSKIKVKFDTFYDDIPDKKYFVLFIFLNILNWALTYFITFIVGLAVGVNLNFVYFLAILPISTIISLIPITINGIGTREITLIGLFALFGISGEKVFSMSVINILIANILPSITAIFLMLKNKK